MYQMGHLMLTVPGHTIRHPYPSEEEAEQDD